MNFLTVSASTIETLAPAATAAVAEMVREAAKEGKAVFPRGGGTHWHYGVMPIEPGVVLSLEKMNRLVDHAAEDMTVTVEASMTFAELSKILASKNQRLPIDVREPEKATLGGLVAVNPVGPRQFGYGTIRDYLLGFTAVDGEGTIFHGGGRVVKNAAGYNMNRLMAGSMGTLCVFTQLTFMVRPLPEKSAIISCDLPDLKTAEKLLASLNKSQVRPVAIELLMTAGTSPFAPRKYAAFAERKATLLSVSFEGTTAEVDWMLDTLRAEWCTEGIETRTMVGDSSDAGASGNCVSTPERGNEGGDFVDIEADVQIAVRPSQVVELVAALQEKYTDCSIQSHAASGIVLMESGWGRAEGKSYYRQLRALAESFGGRMTVLRYPEDVELSRRDIWGPPGEGFSVMQSLKDRFDPRNILNPGRFIFEYNINLCFNEKKLISTRRHGDHGEENEV
jgi:glycolate oxidase FAD binding subunit